MIKELENWTKSIGQAGKLEVEFHIAWGKLFKKYCEMNHLNKIDDCAIANEKLVTEISYYETFGMSDLVHKYIELNESEDINAELSRKELIKSIIYKEFGPMSDEEAERKIKNLNNAIELYSIGVEDVIEILDKINKVSNQLDTYSDELVLATEDTLIQTAEFTKEITRDVVAATKVGINDMKPIVKQGIQDSIPVAKKYVKNLKKSFTKRK